MPAPSGGASQVETGYTGATCLSRWFETARTKEEQLLMARLQYPMLLQEIEDPRLRP